MLLGQGLALGVLHQELRGQPASGAERHHGEQVGQHQAVGLLLGRRHHGVDGQEGARLGVLLGRHEAGPVELQRLGGPGAGEVVGEDVGEALLRGQPGGVVRRAQQPHGRRRRRVRGGVQRVQRAADADRRPVGRHQGADVVDVRRERRDRVVVDAPGAVAQRVRRDGIGARRPADAEVDPARVGGLEQRELLGHDERGVVGQHHAARADPDPLGGRGDHRDQQRRVGGGHRRHVVVLGQPVPPVARLVGHPRQRPGRGQRVTRRLVRPDGHEVEHGQRGSGHPGGTARSGTPIPPSRRRWRVCSVRDGDGHLCPREER